MSDVFISYSRRDIEFVRYLFDQLQAHDRQPWADWQDIPPTADWLAEIYRGIEAANTFLFVISPESVKSEICTLEIEHAVQHNKRLVPVVWQETAEVHASMSTHNWIFLRTEDDFAANFELLLEALDTELTYIREHTRLLTRAIEWEDGNRGRSKVLRGDDLTAAEGWLSVSQSMQPVATELHADYIGFSRATVKRLQRLIYTGSGLAFAVVLGLAVFALFQRQSAIESAQLAEKRARISIAKSLAAFALETMDQDPELSLLLSIRSVESTYDIDQLVLPLSNNTLRQSIIKSRNRLTLIGHDSGVNSATYSPDGQWIVTASQDQTVKIWNAETGQEILTLTGHDGGVTSAFYSPDGQRIVTASQDQTVRLYTTNIDELLAIANKKITRQLTAKEKEKYGLTDQ